MAALWRNVSDPVAGDGRWIALEHELWTYATRSDAARAHLAARYRAAWAGVDTAASGWVGGPADGVGTAVIGTLLGLEMMRRIDPSAVPDGVAVGALCGVVAGVVAGVAPSPASASRMAATDHDTRGEG
jgi:hypothetical protein